MNGKTSSLIKYIFFILMGTFMWQRFYLKKYKSGIVFLILSFIGSSAEIDLFLMVVAIVIAYDFISEPKLHKKNLAPVTKEEKKEETEMEPIEVEAEELPKEPEPEQHIETEPSIDLNNIPTEIAEDPGYVYFIQDVEISGRVKIGKAVSLEKRFRTFDVKLPFQTRVLHTLYSNNYSRTERLFHEYFQEKRSNGEWFTLTITDIDWVKKQEYPPEIINSIRGF